MDIRIYVGAHKTASQHLVSILDSNEALLDAEETVFYSTPIRALRHINEALKAIADGGDKSDITGQMLHALTYGREAKRLLIVNPNVVGAVTRPFGKELFYPRTSGLIHQLHTLFEGNDLQLFASIRNPATFIPSCYAECMLGASFSDYGTFLEEVNLHGLQWSNFLHRLQGKQSDIPLTVWRYEDYPFIWRNVVQAFTGIKNRQELLGNPERKNATLTLQGALLLNRYIEEHPPRTKEDFDNTKQAFLERFPSTFEPTEAPGWSADLIRTLTENYEDDWYYIERIEGIKTIQPRRFE